MMSDIRNDTILSKKAKKKSSRLGKVLNNIRKRKVPPCGTNTFTDPDSVREELKKLCKFWESENSKTSPKFSKKIIQLGFDTT